MSNWHSSDNGLYDIKYALQRIADYLERKEKRETAIKDAPVERDLKNTRSTGKPLIKDKKIRKAVKAWAEANNFKPYAKIAYGYSDYNDGISITWLREEETDIEIHLPRNIFEGDGENTIEELCGEEEE